MKKPLSAPSAHRSSGAALPLRHSAVVEALGTQGHGIARIGGEKIFIPYTLPGETVLLEREGTRGHAACIEMSSPERTTPVCQHFGDCGGCALQHWKEEPYTAWKERLVTSALGRAGVAFPPIEPLKTYPLASRRRATFTASRAGEGAILGYQAERTHRIADLAECPILLPALAEALPELKKSLAPALAHGGEVKVRVTAASNGLDCVIESKKQPADGGNTLVTSLPGAGFVRLIWNGIPLFLSAKPYVYCDGAPVLLPPATFLQAVEACEQDMSCWIAAALTDSGGDKGPLCDLFAGLGAFTFPAARLRPVTAYEGDAAAIEALGSAARGAKGRKPIAAIRRDLFRNPLGPLELNKFTAILIDPPREGAEAQAHAIAQSKAMAVAMLSCNPVSFARDAAILTGSGFTLSRLAAFDQFRFSAHVEIAALFLRQGKKKGGA